MSDTDSEIIAHLIEEGCNKDLSFEDACMEAFKRIDGSFAILAISSEEEKIVAARKGSPLVCGIGSSGYFVSSDIPSFIDHTKDVVYLYDGDVVIATPDEIRFYNLIDECEVEREIDTVDWDAETAKKGEFDHFMLKEISEQEETIQLAIRQDKETIDYLVNLMREAKGIFFIGCGSSYHACLTASYLFSKIARIHVNVVLGSEFENYEHFLTDETLVLVVSQSGETADILGATRAAKRHGSRVVGITNVMGSSLTRESDLSLLMNAGPEICVLSTKTYTSQLALLTLLAYAMADRYDEGVEELRSLWGEVYNLTSRSMREQLRVLAEHLRETEHIFLIGRGLQYPTALEAALKIKEVSYLHAEAYAGGELKHGPLALIEEGTPCIVFSSEENLKKTISNMREVKTRGGYIIGVSHEADDDFDYWVKVPAAGDMDPIMHVIPMQIIAYELAVLRGFDPDKPRNLAKSVTVL